CIPDWNCTAWTDCEGGRHARSCKTIDGCQRERPNLTEACAVEVLEASPATHQAPPAPGNTTPPEPQVNHSSPFIGPTGNAVKEQGSVLPPLMLGGGSLFLLLLGFLRRRRHEQ